MTRTTALRSWRWPALAPIGVAHFYNLVRAGYYDDSRFSRTIAGWITQFGVDGDPAATAVWANRRIRDDPVRASNGAARSPSR